MPYMRKTRVALVLVTGLVLTACGQGQTNFPDKRPGDTSPTWTNDKPQDSVFGPGGLNLFGGDKKKEQDQNGAGIGVNAYLWRASLDTLAFMPLSSADPFGGVILTEWYAPPESPRERFKMSVFIADRTLRADGVKVAVFRQVQSSSGDWSDAPVDAKTATTVEDAILTRAREIRSAAAAVK